VKYKKFYDPSKKPSQEIVKQFEKAVTKYKKMQLVKKLKEVFNEEDQLG